MGRSELQFSGAVPARGVADGQQHRAVLDQPSVLLRVGNSYAVGALAGKRHCGGRGCRCQRKRWRWLNSRLLDCRALGSTRRRFGPRLAIAGREQDQGRSCNEGDKYSHEPLGTLAL